MFGSQKLGLDPDCLQVYPLLHGQPPIVHGWNSDRKGQSTHMLKSARTAVHI
jgi:hypothetical protein